MFSFDIQKSLWTSFDLSSKTLTLAFSILLLLSPWRWPIFLGILLFYYFLKKTSCYLRMSNKALEFIVRHVNLIAGLIVLLGILFRVLMFVVVKDDLAAPYGSDSGAFLQKIQAFDSGIWIQNKSWITILAYGCWGKLFSTSYLSLAVCGNILQILTIIFAFLIGKKLFGVLGGLILESYIAFDLMLLVLSNAVYLENIYYLVTIISIFMTLKMYEASTTFTSIMFTILTSFFCWCMIWTRSDGIVFMIALVLLYTVLCICGRVAKKYIKFLTLIIISFVFAASSYLINVNIDGSQTIFCSNDNYIPRVMGVSYRNKGCYDKQIIVELHQQYLKDYPEKREMVEKNTISQPLPYMNDLIPYCKKMIKELSNSLTLTQWFDLIISKEKNIFWGNISITPNSKLFTFLLCIYRNSIITFLCIPVLWSMLKKRESEFLDHFFSIITMGIFLLYIFGEASPRYGQLFFFLLAILSASKLKDRKLSLHKNNS